MKNPKFQPPTVKGIPDSAPRAASGDDLWGLRFGVSLVLGVWCLVFFSTASAFSQSYSLDWFTIDGGGGTSSGGSYTLNGTIGQPDAGTLSGGSYTLEGGFWSSIVVPATGEAPTLFIQFSGNNVVHIGRNGQLVFAFVVARAERQSHAALPCRERNEILSAAQTIVAERTNSRAAPEAGGEASTEGNGDHGVEATARNDRAVDEPEKRRCAMKNAKFQPPTNHWTSNGS